MHLGCSEPVTIIKAVMVSVLSNNVPFAIYGLNRHTDSNVNCVMVLQDNFKCQQFQCWLVVCTIKSGCSLSSCVT